MLGKFDLLHKTSQSVSCFNKRLSKDATELVPTVYSVHRIMKMFQVRTLHNPGKQGIDQQLFKKSISSTITHPRF